jgi:hypothetical protein
MDCFAALAMTIHSGGQAPPSPAARFITPIERRKRMNLSSDIAAANADIRAAILANDMELARVLVSRKVGWRVLSGDIAVKLRKRNYVEFRLVA